MLCRAKLPLQALTFPLELVQVQNRAIFNFLTCEDELKIKLLMFFRTEARGEKDEIEEACQRLMVSLEKIARYKRELGTSEVQFFTTALTFALSERIVRKGGQGHARSES